jgi:hypothetical protein
LSGAGFRPDARAVPAGEIKFVSISLSESSVDAVDKEVMFTFKNGAMRKFTGRSLLLPFSVPQFFFHVTTSLRHPASRRCGSRQEGFFGATAINLKQEWRAEA